MSESVNSTTAASPANYDAATTDGSGQGQTHVVQRGETLSQIARQYGVTLSELITANPQVLNPDVIYPDQAVQIPGSSAVPASAPVETTAVTAPYSGGPLSRVQLAQVFHEAGFRGEDLVSMVAIAIRESNGNPAAHNPDRSTGDNSYGLTQINMLGNLGPWIRETFHLTSNEQLFDPSTNARVAYGLAYMVQGKPLFPWGPYRGDPATHNTDVPAARAAVQQAEAQGLLGQPFDGATSGSAPPQASAPITASNTSAHSDAPAATSMPTLRIGARGAAVSDLQRQLKATGFNPGPVDGWFGPQTRAAVRRYQLSQGITVDGWVGPQTWGKLLEARASTGNGRSDGRLMQGASGNAVADLQRQLRDAGYYHASIGGNFGPLTTTAVRDFQRDHGLTVDGWAGPQTLAALQAASHGGTVNPAPASTVPTSGPPSRSPSTATTPAQGVTPITSGPREQRVQAALDYGRYWATQQTAYVGGASEYRYGGVGDGHTDKSSSQRRYLAPLGVVGFDCSGLVVAMYAQAGVDLRAHGMTYTGAMLGLPGVSGPLQPGDLLVKNGHVVVYLGDVTGDGRADVVEATPYGHNPGDGSVPVPGVRINDAEGFLRDAAYSAHRIPSEWFA